GIGHMRVAADIESALRIGPAVEYETIEVRVGDIAAELADLHSTRPSLCADLRAFELADRVLRKRHPKADLVGARGYIVPVNVVRMGDPEGRHRVVRGDQNILGGLPIPSQLRRAGCSKVGRDARLGCMTLGLDPEVADELIAVRD